MDRKCRIVSNFTEGGIMSWVTFSARQDHPVKTSIERIGENSEYDEPIICEW